MKSHGWGARLRTASVCAALFALAACDSEADTSVEIDALESATSDVAGAEQQALEHVALAAFEGSWDPATESFDLRIVEWTDEGALRRGTRPLYCPQRVSSGRPDTIGLANGGGGVGFTPTDCGFPNVLPYSTLGTFCGSVDVISYFDVPLTDVYAEIASVAPESGHLGYAFPNGTGADPANLVAGPNAPVDSFGLWHHGTIAAGSTGSAQWTFQYTPEPFTFSGRIVAAIPEVLNGVDDNCDGVADETPLADGQACTDDSDCYHDCNTMSGVCYDPSSACPAGFWGVDCDMVCGCDDSLFCNGEEICDRFLGCLAGTAPDPDDGVACTDDSCNEATDSIDNVPNNANCDDSLFCNGAETCDATLDCQAGTAPTVDDGVACTDDSCNEATDSIDNVPNNARCDDTLFCNGAETCDAALNCVAGTAPNPDDGVACTDDSCNEATDSIDNIPNNTRCDDTLFCNGAETCDAALNCVAGTAPNPDDGVACTDDSCNEATDSIDNIPNNANCDDTLFCNGVETCDATLDCQAGSAPTIDDGNPCTDDSCDEVNDAIVNANSAAEAACGTCVTGSCECWDGVCTNTTPFSLDMSADFASLQDCVHNTGDGTNDGMDAGSYLFGTNAIAAVNLPNDGVIGGNNNHPTIQLNVDDADPGNNCWNAGISPITLPVLIPPVNRSATRTFEAEALPGNTGQVQADYREAGVADPQNHMVFGPYIDTLREGMHTATYRILLDVVGGGNLSDITTTIDVVDSTAGQVLASATLQRGDFAGGFVYTDFTLDFSMVGRAGHLIETRVFHHASSYQRVDFIEIAERTPQVHIIGSSVDGDSNVDVTLQYDDASSTTQSVTFTDWFAPIGPGLSALLSGMDRWTGNGAVYEDVNATQIHYASFDIDPNKTLTSVEMNQTGGSGGSSRFIFFGMSLW